MNKRTRSAVLGFGLCIAVVAAGPAHAHRTWMLPSATVISGEDAWITVDAAVSNDLFYFNHHPLRLDDLEVKAPDGSAVEVQNASVGKYRSSFDVPLRQQGTYKLTMTSDSLFARYSHNGTHKRWRGTRAALATEIPPDATDLSVRHSQRRMEAFATLGAPDRTVLEPTGSGLEMVPVTHPNDLFAGETARFRLLLDGQPAGAVSVEVVRGNTRYRNDAGTMHAQSDGEGVFEVTWPEAGMYWLNASVEQEPSKGGSTESRTASYTATLEVLPQ